MIVSDNRSETDDHAYMHTLIYLFILALVGCLSTSVFHANLYLELNGTNGPVFMVTVTDCCIAWVG